MWRSKKKVKKRRGHRHSDLGDDALFLRPPGGTKRSGWNYRYGGGGGGRGHKKAHVETEEKPDLLVKREAEK